MPQPFYCCLRPPSKISSCLLVLAAGIAILAVFGSEPKSSDGLYADWKSYGFGVSLKGNSLVSFTVGQSVTQNVLLVNTPQVLVSVVYVLYNAVLTSTVLTAESSAYSLVRRALRVSQPRGDQRSTYWLSLPYQYALPLMATMGILHWLISQSLFLVRFRLYPDHDSPEPRKTTSGCGWSPLAVFWSCVVGAVLILSLHLNSFRRLPQGMPVLSSCSAALSAASHRENREDEDMVERKLMYGDKGANGDGSSRVGFSAEEVDPLVDGTLYR